MRPADYNKSILCIAKNHQKRKFRIRECRRFKMQFHGFLTLDAEAYFKDKPNIYIPSTIKTFDLLLGRLRCQGSAAVTQQWDN